MIIATVAGISAVGFINRHNKQAQRADFAPYWHIGPAMDMEHMAGYKVAKFIGDISDAYASDRLS